MADLCRVLVVGNLRSDIERRIHADGTVYGASLVCAGRTILRRGYPETETVLIPIEVAGATRVASVAQQFGAGSRVLIEGHLEPRQAGGQPLVLVIDTIFNADSPEPVAEAARQPRRRFGELEQLP